MCACVHDPPWLGVEVLVGGGGVGESDEIGEVLVLIQTRRTKLLLV